MYRKICVTEMKVKSENTQDGTESLVSNLGEENRIFKELL